VDVRIKDEKMLTANWNYPTQVLFGPGRVSELYELCSQKKIHNPLVVCDAFLLSQTWYQDHVASLPSKTLFKDFKSNPDEINIGTGVDVYRTNHCDGIIAIGGGSALDCAKTIALMVAQTRPLWDFIDAGDNFKRANSVGIPDIIAIPTTAGTGSEVGRAAVIVNSTSHVKHIIFHPKMLPSCVVCDPCLTLSVPPQLTAASGMDALAHNLEAFFAPAYHPMADGIALEGCRLIKDNLVRAYNSGDDIEARTQMMAAATMGATAFQKGLGLIHALSHPVGGLYDIHHGLLNAIFMPYVLLYNRQAIEQKCEFLTRYIDLKPYGFDSLYQWISQLCQELQIPQKLTEIGIDDSQAQKIAELAMRDPSASGNPRELTVEDCKTVFINAVNGTNDLCQ
jgi:alcohol dehydrogenase class IV